MTFRLPATIFTACAVTLVAACASVWIWAQGGGRLDAKRARELLRNLGGAELEREQVRIKSVSPGIGGGGTIVEAQIETAVRFAEQGGEWRAAEIRVGDRQWESVELILEAVRREKIRRTELMLRRIAEGLENYRRERNSYVVAENLDGLINVLPPHYVELGIRFDLWHQPLSYRGTVTSFRLSSSGPDRQPGTGDDLIIEGSGEPRVPQ
jgi:hypothetical protein